MAIGNTIQQTTQTNFGYDKDVDYQKLIDDAVKAQDWTRAAVYEAMRNEKIAGEGAPYQPTYQYASYLPGNQQAGQPNGQPAPAGAAQQGVEQIDLQASAMPQYVNPYQEQLDAAIAGLDPEAYKRLYLQEASRSAQDTLGKYAAMTGGIPSTAAVSAATQAADYQKSQLAAKLVNLNTQRANLLMNAEKLEQSNYQARISAAMSRWTQLGYADQEVQDTLGVPVGTPTSSQSYANWSKSQAEQQVQREQADAAKAEAYNLAMKLLSAGIMPDAATLALAGIPQSAAQALYQVKTTSGTETKDDTKPVYMTDSEFSSLQSQLATMAATGDLAGALQLLSSKEKELTEEQIAAARNTIDTTTTLYESGWYNGG